MDDKLIKSFKILELSTSATLEEAKQAWKDLIQVWHPDKHQNNERLRNKATEKLKEINAAWDEVKDWFAWQKQREQERILEAEQDRVRQARAREDAEQAERVRRQEQEERRRAEEARQRYEREQEESRRREERRSQAQEALREQTTSHQNRTNNIDTAKSPMTIARLLMIVFVFGGIFITGMYDIKKSKRETAESYRQAFSTVVEAKFLPVNIQNEMSQYGNFIVKTTSNGHDFGFKRKNGNYTKFNLTGLNASYIKFTSDNIKYNIPPKALLERDNNPITDYFGKEYHVIHLYSENINYKSVNHYFVCIIDKDKIWSDVLSEQIEKSDNHRDIANSDVLRLIKRGNKIKLQFMTYATFFDEGFMCDMEMGKLAKNIITPKWKMMIPFG